VTGTLDDYRWAESDDDIYMSLAITWVAEADSPDKVFSAGGNRWRSTGRSTLAQCLDFHRGGFDAEHEPLLVDHLGDWLVLVAPNGFEYSYPGVAAGASRIGRLITVFWNVEAVMRVIVAENGRVVRTFDPLFYDGDAEALPEEAGLGFGADHARLHAASLLFAERLTGRPLTESWLLAEHDGYLIDRRAWEPDDRGCERVLPLDLSN